MRWFGLLILAGMLTLTIVAVWRLTSKPHQPVRVVDDVPPDPRLGADTPFRNVRPEVQYVGDAACASCHEDVCAAYHTHPMGRSATWLAGTKPVEKLNSDGPTQIQAGPYQLNVEAMPDGFLHTIRLRENSIVPVPDLQLPVQIAIGSGTRGRSYLSVSEGRVWQTPLSWYGPDERWDVSPGFRLGHTVRRAITGECLFCHVDQVHAIEGTENQFREPIFARQAAIGCERCHGPGSLHAAERMGDPNAAMPDFSIVNPKHLAPTLQLAICEQCHLQGEDRVIRRGQALSEYRPGLRFEDFVSVFVRHPDLATPNKSVGQFEQMEQSRCFIQSKGQLTCTSCHDPHVAPAPEARAAHYRNRCQECHAPSTPTECKESNTIREQLQNDCTACHMPKASSANIVHTSVTDHRVPRAPGKQPVSRGLAFGTLPLQRFRPGEHLAASERDRDLGIALARFTQKNLPPELTPERDSLRSTASARLKTAVATWPTDLNAWIALAESRSGRGASAIEKLQAAIKAVELAPDSELALLTLTEAATAAERFDVAIESATRLINRNPSAAEPYVVRAFVHIKRGAWAAAESDSRAALAIHPIHPESRLYLAICLTKQGDVVAGLREARTAAQTETDPREKAYLLDWYKQATR